MKSPSRNPQLYQTEKITREQNLGDNQNEMESMVANNTITEQKKAKLL